MFADIRLDFIQHTGQILLSILPLDDICLWDGLLADVIGVIYARFSLPVPQR
jgi:hypothetical protein